jgi:hypothetical protein
MLCFQVLRATRSNGLHRAGIRGAGIAMAIAVAVVLPNAIPVPAYAQDASRGAALLAEARTAIGGEQRLAGVRALQVTGTFRRVVNGNDTEGDFEVFIELPDRYLRSEKTGTPGQPSTETIEALVGAEVRDEVRGGGGRGGGGGANVGAEGFPPADFGGDPDAELQVEGRGDRLTGGTDIARGRAAGPAGGNGSRQRWRRGSGCAAPGAPGRRQPPALDVAPEE